MSTDDSSITDLKSLLIWAGLGSLSPSELATQVGTAGTSASAVTAMAVTAAIPTSVAPDLSPIAELLKLTGFQPTAHFSSFAHVAEAVFNRTIDKWKINGEDPSMAEHGQISLAWHKARQLCHVEAVPSAPVTVQVPASGSGQLTTSGGLLNVATIKLSSVIDQTNSSEITFLPTKEVQKMIGRYILAWEEPPSSEVKPSTDQLSAILHTLQRKLHPYADFSVWKPHAARWAKKQSMRGLVPQRDGTFAMAEFFGPNCLSEWLACYDVLAAALLMAGACTRPRLSAYRKKIKLLHAAYGPLLWPLLYQTDVRCRQELMEELFHELLAKHNMALETKSPTSFNVDEPWDQVWDEATNRTTWWTDQFERHAGLIANHVRSMSSVLDGDVLTAHHRDPAGSPPQQQQQQQHAAKGGGKVKKQRKKNNNGTGNAAGAKGAKAGGKAKSCRICWSDQCPGATNLKDCPKYDPDFSKKQGKGKNGKGKGSGW